METSPVEVTSDKQNDRLRCAADGRLITGREINDAEDKR